MPAINRSPIPNYQFLNGAQASSAQGANCDANDSVGRNSCSNSTKKLGESRFAGSRSCCCTVGKIEGCSRTMESRRHSLEQSFAAVQRNDGRGASGVCYSPDHTLHTTDAGRSPHSPRTKMPSQCLRRRKARHQFDTTALMLSVEC